MDITKIVKPAVKPVVAKCVALRLAHASSAPVSMLQLDNSAIVSRKALLHSKDVSGDVVLLRCASYKMLKKVFTSSLRYQGQRERLGLDAPADTGLQAGVLQL